VGEAFDGVLHTPISFSPDGSSLAETRHPTGGRDEIVVYDLSRPNDRGVALGGAGDSRSPVWTPDGTRLTFYSTRNGTRDIFEVPADFSTEPEPLLVGDEDQIPLSWAPDGTVLAFWQGPAGGTGDIWLLPRGGEPTPLLANPAIDEGDAAFSPDGRYLAYTSDESGRYEVYVQGYPTPRRRLRISTEGGGNPMWARDGLYYSGPPDGELYFVPIAPGAELPVRVTPQRLVRALAISPDGQTLVGSRSQNLGSAPSGSSLALVVNWFEELKRLVPTN